VANKTTIRSLFKAIRHGDRDLVRTMLDADPTLVNACALVPPKKDDGQSPLQVALKTGKTEISSDLLERGANVNFIERSELNHWRAPALHDAIRGAVVWAGPRTPGYEHWFPNHFAVLDWMLELGADPNAVDSYGNTCLDRLILDARSKAATPDEWRGAAGEDVRRILDALLSHGADPMKKGQHGETAYEFAKGTPVESMLHP